MPSQAGRAKGETVVVVVGATVVGTVEVDELVAVAAVETVVVAPGVLPSAVGLLQAASTTPTAATPNQTRLRMV